MWLILALLLTFSFSAFGGGLSEETIYADDVDSKSGSATFFWKDTAHGTWPDWTIWNHVRITRNGFGQTLHAWKHEAPIRAVALSPDGYRVLIGDRHKAVVLKDMLSGNDLKTWTHKDQVLCVAFSPDGRQALTGSADMTAVLRDTISGDTLRSWKHNNGVSSVAFSPDGKQVLTGSWDNSAVLRDARTGDTLRTWRHNDSVSSVAFSPDGKQVLTGSWDKTVVLRDLKSGDTVQVWKHRDEVFSVAFSPDGKRILAGTANGTAVLRDMESKKVLHTWRYKTDVINVTFSYDGKQVLIGSSDEVSLRDPQTGKTLQTLKVGNSSVIISPLGGIVLRGNPDGYVALQLTEPDFNRVLNSELEIVSLSHTSLPKNLLDRKSELENSKPIKEEFESVSQFNQRVAQWNTAADRLNVHIQAHHAKLGPLPLDRRAQAFERAFSRAYGNPELHDIRYDPETARFFATLKASHDPNFKRLLSIAVPNDQARAMKGKLTSDENGLEIELRFTDQYELIWGRPRVRLGGKIFLLDYVDKDFVTPITTAIVSDPQLKTILPPPIAILPSTPDVKVIDDPKLNNLQMEVLQKEREQAAKASREAEEKRLRERLAELNRQTNPEFKDDLPKLLAKVPVTKPNPKLHVLAIGISDYADVPDVPFADRSALQFAEIAKKLLGAESQNVIVLTDSQATLGRLLGRLNTLLNRLEPEDQLFLYYAGHGVAGKDGAYLLAQDGGAGSYEQTSLQLSHLYKAIAKSKVGQAKIFIDACFSGRSGKDTIVFEGIAPVIPRVDQSFPDSQRLVVITAGRGDQFSNQDKARGHRLFSYHLMRLLLEEGHKLEIAKLHKRLRDIVLNESRRIGPEFEQEPELQGNGRIRLLN
jgi:WD40 repeat protein